MANRPAFGRRGVTRPAPQAPQGARPAAAIAAAPPAPAMPDAASAADIVAAPDPVERELDEWKRARERAPFPWRPFYFMASLCFGLASFVLPAAINDVVQWPLYGLAAISFAVGIANRRRRKAQA